MKRVSPGTVTVAAFAILFGLVAAYIVRHYLSGTATRPPVRQTAAVIVPTVNLPKYSRIREQDLEVVELPIRGIPQGAMRIKSRALFRLVKETVLAGQPILEENLYGVGEVPLLADQLPPGYRAVTLQVDANSALNGMIQPESYVDITLTVKDKQPPLEGLATLTLLRRVKVLATSQARFPRSEDRPGALRNITVAVSPKQANKLILAQRYGTLSVTLRSSLEGEMLAEADDHRDMVHPNDLLGLAMQPAPESVEKKAQIWRGGKMEEVTFGGVQIQEALAATAVADGRRPMPAIPVGSRQSTPSVPSVGHIHALPNGRGCKDCQKKRPARVAPVSHTTGNVPTLAPPQDTATLAAGARFDRQLREEVIYVRVEADTQQGAKRGREPFVRSTLQVVPAKGS